MTLIAKTTNLRHNVDHKSPSEVKEHLEKGNNSQKVALVVKCRDPNLIN